MQYYSVAEKYALLEKINSNLELTALLDLFGEEIEKISAFDGYAFNLLDAGGTYLESLKLRFAPEFKELEHTYFRYKIALKSEQLNTSARAFNTLSLRRATVDNGTADEKRLLSLWKLHEIAALPLAEWTAGQASNPVGVVALFRQEVDIDQTALKKVEELVSLFHKPLSNARHFAFLKDYHARFEAAAAEQARFLQFIVDMNNITSPERIYEMFSVELFHQLKFDVLAFFLQEDDALKMKKVASVDPTYEAACAEWQQFMTLHPFDLDTTDGGVPHTFLRNSPLLFSDVQKILHLPMSEKDRMTMVIFDNIRTLLILPIRSQDKSIGVITFFSMGEPLPVSDSDLKLLNNLSAFFGAAITNSKNMLLNQMQHREIERLNLMLQDKVKELSEQAATDKLTGLSNYRVFEQELGRRINEFERKSTREGLSIAVIDIDHFKKFNDSYGHQAGNVVLAGVAHEIAKLVRKMDLACRYGGEEFVVILSKCDLDGVQIFSERVRQAVEAASFETDAGRLSVTVSIGCTTHQDQDNFQSFFNRADQALYQAKKNGRNRVEAI